jgi:AraC-like DNA-binding protein
MDLFENEMIVTKIAAAVFVPKGKGTPIHKNRPYHGLAFNVGCTVTYRFDREGVLVCHAGELIYLPKGSNYTVERGIDGVGESCGVYAINFDTSLAQNENRPTVIKVHGSDKMQSLFERAERAWKKEGAGFYEACLADLYTVIAQLKAEAASYAPYQKNLSALAPALDYINEHFTEESIKVEQLAALCGVSEPYLRRLFGRTFSVSPAVYMRNLRIKYAEELLHSGEYSVTDAATLSGFNDIAYFSRSFKKETGVSPREYAKAYGEG